MTKPLFNNLVILGVGLMGGSLALAAKKAGVVGRITGWSRRQSTLDTALEMGVIDSAEANLGKALLNADCVVVATPTQFAEELMIKVLETVAESVVVTDVASVKGNLERAIKNHFGSLPANAVLGHPIAGSEQSGVAAADAGLFTDRRIILIGNDSQQTLALQQAVHLWRAIGASVDVMTAEKHDAVLALTSHLPHFLAYALVVHLAADDTADDIFRYAGGGFRDFTRIAASDPRMWREISLANKSKVVDAVEQFQQHLSVFKQALADDDGQKLESLFAEAKQVRDQFKQHN